MTKHSFYTHSCWCNSTCARGSQKNKPSINTAIFLLFAECPWYLCYFSSYVNTVYWSFNLLLQRYMYVRKSINAKNPAILRFFFVTKRTKLNTAHVYVSQKIAIECGWVGGKMLLWVNRNPTKMTGEGWCVGNNAALSMMSMWSYEWNLCGV